MSEKTTPAFPFAMPFGVAALQKSVSDAQARWGSLLDDAAKVEAQGAAHTRMMMDEGVKLAQETFSYWAQLREDWRRVSLEATKRTLDTLTPR